MITRVSEQMRYSTIISSLTKAELAVNDLLEQLATEKKVNRPSDDPVGMGKILSYRSTIASINQYQNNISNANTWASMTEACLEDVDDLISQATDIGASFSGDDTSLNTALANSIQQIMESIMATANTTLDGRYLFSGTMTDTEPFTDVTDPTIDTTGATFDGDTVLGGVFTENADKDYLVQIVSGGDLGTATYRISTDGGTTWGSTSTVPESGTITLTDSSDVDGGLTLSFVDNGTTSLTTGDQFVVSAYTSAEIDSAVAATGNTYTGTVTSGGTYTGTENNTYAVKITGAGGLGVATYDYSTDGGATWTTGGVIPASGAVSLADGVTLTFSAGTFAVDDMFSVDAKAPGFYNGNDEDLVVDIGNGKTISCNVTGDEVFSDIFTSLKNLKAAILSGDQDTVNACVSELQNEQTNVNTIISMLGFKEQTLNTWNDSYDTLGNNLANLKSDLEDADMTTLAAAYSLRETALEATYTIASEMADLTILNYLS